MLNTTANIINTTTVHNISIIHSKQDFNKYLHNLAPKKPVNNIDYYNEVAITNKLIEPNGATATFGLNAIDNSILTTDDTLFEYWIEELVI